MGLRFSLVEIKAKLLYLVRFINFMSEFELEKIESRFSSLEFELNYTEPSEKIGKLKGRYKTSYQIFSIKTSIYH